MTRNKMGGGGGGGGATQNRGKLNTSQVMATLKVKETVKCLNSKLNICMIWVNIQ